MKKNAISQLVVAGCLLGAAASQSAQAAEPDYYKGKTVSIVVGLGAGGSLDFMARLMARYMPQQVAGQPTIIVQNMPGGKGNVSANYVYNRAKPDGLTLYVPPTGVPVAPLLDQTGIQFDPGKMIWLGSLSKAEYTLLLRSDRPYQTLADLRKAKGPIYLGADSGTGVLTTTQLIKEVLDLPIKVIPYESGQEIDLAVERNEVDGRVNGIATLLTRNRDWLQKKMVNVVLPVREGRHPAFPDVPTLYEIAPADKKPLIDLATVQDTWMGALATSPGVPDDRVQLLRQAFDRMVQGEEFKKGLESRAPFSPTSGAELQKKIEALSQTSPEMRATFRRLSGLE